MSKLWIYGLSYIDFLSEDDYKNNNPIDSYFYIGRTNDPVRREKEHRYKAKDANSREDVYVFIRELAERSVSWELVKLKKIDENDNRPWEYNFIIKFIQNGFSLKNMRFGIKNESINHILAEIADSEKKVTIDKLAEIINKKKEKENKNPDERLYSSHELVQAKAIKKQMTFVRRYVREGDPPIKMNVFNIGSPHGEIHAQSGLSMLDVALNYTPARIQWWQDFHLRHNLFDKE